MKLRFLAAVLLAGLAIPASAAAAPRRGTNVLVDLDHGLQFPDNKQNEPDITRDPGTGVLVAGANDEADSSCESTHGKISPHRQK